MDYPVLAKPISQQVLRKLDASLEGVDIVIHQNALLDIVEKIQKFTNDVLKNAKHLIGTELQEQNENFVNATENNVEIKSPKPKFQRQNSRKMSFATTVQVARWGKRAKRSIARQNSVLEEHPTELMVSTVTNEYLHAIVIL